MEEHDLHFLGLERSGPGGRTPPVDAVLRRGRQLRRRRHMARSVSAVTALGCLAVVAVVALRPESQANVATRGIDQLPVEELTCEAQAELDEQYAPVDLNEVDNLRYIPESLPGDLLVRAVGAWRIESQCPGAEPALVLQADGGDDIVEASITLKGPYRSPVAVPWQDRNGDITLRDRQAQRILNGTDVDATFLGYRWTEADGSSWSIETDTADEATVRAVAEVLELESAPSGDSPTAGLPEDAVPPGYEIIWQSPGLPAVDDSVGLLWQIDAGDPDQAVDCWIDIKTTKLDAFLDVVATDSASTRLVVQHDPYMIGEPALRWRQAPGIVGEFHCDEIGDVATALDVVESLKPIDPDDLTVSVNPDPAHLP